MTNNTVKKYHKIISIYDKIVKDTGEYSTHLGREYFAKNTAIECSNQKIKDVGRLTIWRVLKLRKEVEERIKFI